MTRASSMLIEEINRDREWVCTGELMNLSARVGGAREPEAVYRWVWPIAGGGAELEPGPRLQWQAPETPGKYRVRFQICTDLGGRRVGVLAERELELEVRQCGEGEGQAHEPLRLGIFQGLRGAFSFQALYQGRESITAYEWDFGDGTRETTDGPLAEHTYSLEELEPDEPRSFTVKLTTRLHGGGTLEATGFALVRGPPDSDEEPPVALKFSRWRPRPNGEGWQSELAVRTSEGSDVTWERLERHILRWNDTMEARTLDWREVIRVDEHLPRGGFRGQVLVSPAESTTEIKQIVDKLYGRDAQGEEVVVSWTPYKAEAPPVPPEPVAELPPGK